VDTDKAEDLRQFETVVLGPVCRRLGISYSRVASVADVRVDFRIDQRPYRIAIDAGYPGPASSPAGAERVTADRFEYVHVTSQQVRDDPAFCAEYLVRELVGQHAAASAPAGKGGPAVPPPLDQSMLDGIKAEVAEASGQVKDPDAAWKKWAPIAAAALVVIGGLAVPAVNSLRSDDPEPAPTAAATACTVAGASTTSEGLSGPGTTEDGTPCCPDEAPLKGDPPSLAYYAPGQEGYETVTPQVCFTTPESAQSFGFTAANGTQS
jgi:hypothetical protein